MRDKLRDYIKLGFSIIPLAENKKIPIFGWKRYQYQRPSVKELDDWFTDKKRNVGVVTGDISRLVVVDIDNTEKLGRLLARLPEAKETSRVRTRRGYHFYFRSEKSYQSKRRFLDIEEVELKANGSYVVAPQSVVQGNTYRFEIPLDRLIYFPSRFINEVKEEPKEDLTKIRYNGKDVDCIRQILGKDLEEGERDVSLHILYNLLCQNRNDENFVKAIVRRKNVSLSKPLPKRELRDVWRKRYKYSCQRIREQLPFVNCEECRYGFRRWRMEINSLIWRNQRKLPELTSPEVKALFFIEFFLDGKEPSVTKLSKVAGMEWKVAKRALDGLKKKQILK